MPFVADMDILFDRWLGLEGAGIGQLPKYQHETTLQQLSTREFRVRKFNLADEALKVVQTALLANLGNPGRQNFEFRQVITLSEKSTSREVTLERSIIQAAVAEAAVATKSKRIGNMMPVASGVFDVGADGRTAIDLVEISDKQLSLIELKVAGYTPLSAAFQILRYGMCYATARAYPARFGCVGSEDVFNAQTVKLIVLAPHSLYAGYGPDGIAWLCSLGKQINQILEQADLPLRYNNQRYSMTFAFEHFPEEFQWDAQSAKSADGRTAALKAFTDKQPLTL